MKSIDLLYKLLWSLRVEHGTCAAVELPPAKDADHIDLPTVLTSEERLMAESLAPLRRVSWVGGRCAMRFAGRELGWELGTIGSTPRGAPTVPSALVGSIAHKTRLAVALLAEAWGGTVGVDLEELGRPRPNIANLVLRKEERKHVSSLPASEQWRAILLRFSIKEAIFKALDPFVQRYVGFKEADVEPLLDGSTRIELNLSEGEGPFDLEGRWYIHHGHILTTVRARRVGR